MTTNRKVSTTRQVRASFWLGMFFFMTSALAASEFEGTIVKVDAARKTMTVKTDGGTRKVSISNDTLFFGSFGGNVFEGVPDGSLPISPSLSEEHSYSCAGKGNQHNIDAAPLGGA